MTSVLFVCLGNICRSPTAHGIFEKELKTRGLTDITVDSAGTGDWHLGRAPDARATAAAKNRGIELAHLRARLVTPADFSEFDYILAMDDQNLRDLKDMAPAGYQGHLGLFLDFSRQQAYREVPDPYYGDGDGFETVLDLVEDAVDGLLTHIGANRA